MQSTSEPCHADVLLRLANDATARPDAGAARPDAQTLPAAEAARRHDGDGDGDGDGQAR